MRFLGLPFLASLLASLLVAMPALAEGSKTAVMVPPHVEAGISDALVTRALEELRRQLEQSSEQYTVISHGQAVALAEADQADRFAKPKGESDAARCVSADCAVWFRTLLNADMAVQLSVFNQVDEKKRLVASSLTIVLVQDAEARWSASASLRDVKVESAVSAAFAEAMLKRGKGVGPWISVTGTPENAKVYLDRQLIGRLPLEKTRVENPSSMHVLSVEAPGYQTATQTIEMRGDISREEVIHVDLVKSGQVASLAGSEDTSASGARRESPRWVRYADPILGALFVGAGAAHLAVGIQKQIREDDCRTEGASGQCLERYGDDNKVSTAAWMMGAGALGIGLGVVAFWVKPVLRLSGGASRNSASLELEGRF